MQTELLDFSESDAEAGFRLHRMEMYNWGTFDRFIWSFSPSGHNSLLTGEIGSGKSTIVDAVTTLLVPHNRIVYNKAAGAESKERSLYSYIRGEYKTEKSELTQSAKAVALRDENNYTVLLAHFYNEGYDQHISIAQVFWLKDNKRNPERFFVISSTPLSISDQFSDFGDNILDLKKRLKKEQRIEVFDNFKAYSSRFRQLFGINNEQALDLFYQTVSMKSVGNLTEFVRHHMLEKSNVDTRIEDLKLNFDNLNRAHEAVVKARHQVNLLKPLLEVCDKYTKSESEKTEHLNLRNIIPAYFACEKIKLFKILLDELSISLATTKNEIATHKNGRNLLLEKRNKINDSISEHGGRRIQVIAEEINRLTKDRERNQATAIKYQNLIKILNCEMPNDANRFYVNLAKLKNMQTELELKIENLQKEQIDLSIEMKTHVENENLIINELESLKKRKSNIPSRMLIMRQQMTKTLNIEDDDIPFIGELLHVKSQQKQWEGSIERLLHNFGLSLLVADNLYKNVCHYVDQTELRGRLVYFRVKNEPKKTLRPNFNAQALSHKIEIKPNSDFYEWLESTLITRFDYACCETLNDFKRLPRAITIKGQIKSNESRHEKDDRYALNDRSRFVLGWSNEEKIKALQEKLKNLQVNGQKIVSLLSNVSKDLDSIGKNRDTCRDLLQFEKYESIDWQSQAKAIDQLAQEKSQIEKSSNILITLKKQLAEVEREITENDFQLEKSIANLGMTEQKYNDSSKELEISKVTANEAPIDNQQLFFPKITTVVHNILKNTLLTIEMISDTKYKASKKIQNSIDLIEKENKHRSNSIIQKMQQYIHDYPKETAEVDATTDAIPDYRRILSSLQHEDLPHHEERFKELLNEGTINSIALFQNTLTREKQDIENKIKTINRSLQEIEYNVGTYIKLVTDISQDLEIRDFQQQLRHCLSDTMNPDSLYDEEKFLHVKVLIDRFNGREGYTDIDRKWTKKVTDVKNWFNFSAIELWKEDHSEKEYYTDSSGKSGGQKEKLAYTILASALAYQFGLEWGVTRSRSFRFVMIDEAFGKGSDESTRYALELFRKLNLQLLIVTPLQKIRVIEDYVRSVHYIHNQDGQRSTLKNITINEYKNMLKEHRTLAETS